MSLLRKETKVCDGVTTLFLCHPEHRLSLTPWGGLLARYMLAMGPWRLYLSSKPGFFIYTIGTITRFLSGADCETWRSDSGEGPLTKGKGANKCGINSNAWG